VPPPRCPPDFLSDHNGQGTHQRAPLPTAQQQLAFLEGRKKQLLQAALRAKQKNDVEGAKMHLRQAKGLEPMLEASRNGLPVDIAKVTFRVSTRQAPAPEPLCDLQWISPSPGSAKDSS
jgi:coiled-coil and C2 domain-containing protein 1